MIVKQFGSRTLRTGLTFCWFLSGSKLFSKVLPTELGCVPQQTCVLCGRPLSLVVQLYCPLQYSPYHRFILLFACTKPQCWNKTDSWTALRCQIIDNTAKKSSLSQTEQVGDSFKVVVDDDWGADGADDWGADGADDWGSGGADNWGAGGADDWGADGTDDWGAGGKDSWGVDKTDDWGADGADDLGAEGLAGPSGKYVSRKQEEEHTDISDRNGSLHVASVQADYDTNASTGHENIDIDDLKLQQMNLHVDDPDIDKESDSPVIPEDAANIPVDKTRLKMMCEEPDTSMMSHDTIVPYYVNVFEEPANENVDNHVKKLLRDYERQEGCRIDDTEHMGDNSSKGGQTEGYEKTSVVHKDMKFHRFMKRVSLCPEQCLRYEWNGSPLFIRELSPSDIPTRCRHCGGESVYEFQLMPALVNYLKAEDTGTLVEFGTVLVYACKQSCLEEGSTFKTEQLIVQPDPDQHFFK